MQLIGLAATFTLGLMLAPLAAEGHQSAKVPRIGHLSMLSRSDPTFRRLTRCIPAEAARTRLYRRPTLTIEWRFAEGRLEQLPELAAELIRLKG